MSEIPEEIRKVIRETAPEAIQAFAALVSARLTDIPGMPLVCKFGGRDAYLVFPRPNMLVLNVRDGKLYVVQSASRVNYKMTVVDLVDGDEGPQLVGREVPVDGFWLFHGWAS